MPKIFDLQDQGTIILTLPVPVLRIIQEHASGRQMSISAFLRRIISQNIDDLTDLQFDPVVADGVENWPVKPQRELVK